ncbi:DUF6612 family protein [Lactobacillus sp. PV034]|uniref:DUF6612 family protein n=1 Tax=Lactobacillus sp. PV034 TaxID=2594495 RepID=UPI00223EF275|nr:DUF6612 family protein [Lactobacillus sp. PV034]QNQ80997.1 hypothetical protein FP432_05235 [Lactobacillus sp. PV034]
MRKKILTIAALATTLFIILGVSGCGKKSSSNNLPSAKSLITNNFNKGMKNGHFTTDIKSKELNENASLKGYFKDTSLINTDYSLTNKGKTQTESIWLTPDTMYLLLEQNKGKWIKTGASANNFDPEQVTRRFKPATFKSLNKAVAKSALVTVHTNTYQVAYSGTSSDVWKGIKNLIIDTLNTPGTQNMQVVQMINAGQPQNISVTYTFDKNTKALTSMTIKTNFTVNGSYDFNWNLKYDQLGQHADLAVPSDIQKNAADVSKQSK